MLSEDSSPLTVSDDLPPAPSPAPAQRAQPTVISAGEPRPVQAFAAAIPAPALATGPGTQPSIRQPLETVPPAPARHKTDAGLSGGSTEQIDILLRKMVELKASDLHICVTSPPMIRQDGDMVPIPGTQPLTAEQVQNILWPMVPNRNRDEFDKAHDTDFAHEIPGVARFRCNLFVDLRGMGGVFRVIPSKILSAQDLNLPPQILSLCNLSKGLVVVTGPTGSGKSTTLAALIDYINQTRAAHVITIEDPVEFVHPNKKSLINQRQVGEHTDSFKKALRAALREDPDIVLLGEMRDLETISIAMETAETGHLVFGTLHTSSAPSTVDRIIDQFPSEEQNQVRTMLAGSLKGVIAQMLCKKKNGGRVAALEVMFGVPAVANLIREGKIFQIPSIIQTSRNLGMRLMNDSLLEHVKAGLVDADEALSKTNDKSTLQTIFRQNNINFSPTA
jgi:twitching motility protein PilT